MRVAGMMQQGGFVGSGCPDAVSAAITTLPGIAAVFYDAQGDLFTVSFDPLLTSIEAIFTAVYLAGKPEGREYLPLVVL